MHGNLELPVGSAGTLASCIKGGESTSEWHLHHLLPGADLQCVADVFRFPELVRRSVQIKKPGYSN